MQFTVLTTAFFAGLAAAANHVVKVGESGLTFSPNSLNASKGDTVTFHFYPKNHNVVQAAFASPCQPLSGGFYSGFHATSSGEANTTFMITVQDTKPIWFYCSQGQHCQGGMVGVINQAATGANTIEAFATAAKSASNNTTPTVAAGTGGMLMAAGSSMSNSTGAASTLQVSSLMGLVAGVGLFLL